MKIYLVRNKDSYLHLRYHHLVSWVPKDKATIFNTHEDADGAGEFAFNCDDNARDQYKVIEIDTDAALSILRDLNEVRDLGDCTYDIREREGKGWHGPLVTKWGDAVARAKKLLEDA